MLSRRNCPSRNTTAVSRTLLELLYHLRGRAHAKFTQASCASPGLLFDITRKLIHTAHSGHWVRFMVHGASIVLNSCRFSCITPLRGLLVPVLLTLNAPAHSAQVHLSFLSNH